MSADLEPLIEPFWQARFIADEPVVFIGEHDVDIDAHLLFVPAGPVTVTDAAGTMSYVERRDFEVDREARRIIRKAGSRLPFVHADELTSETPADVSRRLALTHYAPAPHGWFDIPPDVSALLPRARSRLTAGEPLTLVVIGDSISEGYDASGFRGVPPQQPPYTTLVAEGLRRRCGGLVHLRNLAAAGATTEDGIWQASEAAALNPDLVLVAFGMNDACYADADDFGERMTTILERIRATAPDAECLLVTPMLPTPETTWVEPARFPAYRDTLRTMARPGVAIADVMGLWEAVVARKHPQDLSGNGSNHPNDFGHRLYAQVVLAALGASGA